MNLFFPFLFSGHENKSYFSSRTSRYSFVVGMTITLLVMDPSSWASRVMADQASDSVRKVNQKHLKKALKNKKVDLSPVPNYKGGFVSLGLFGEWKKTMSGPGVAMASSIITGQTEPAKTETESKLPAGKEPPANCSTESIVYYADQAPQNFIAEQSGLLYGVKTHTPATRVGNIPGYNSCAIVVHAILKKAGCGWAKWTADAKAIYDMAYDHGWRPSDVQKPGCIVAWNATQEGDRPRIGQGKHRTRGMSKGVAYRHVGITTGTWMAMDNTSVFSRPSAFITNRPIRYEAPIFLCPENGTTGEQKK